jgi:hypothetical protein
VFERCTDGPATLALYQLVMDGKDAEKLLLPQNKVKGKAPELPKDWTPHADFIEQWRAMDPVFDSAAKLRPAMFLSRDVMAPARSRSGLSDAAREAVAALLKISDVNSPVGKTLIEGLAPSDRQAAMSSLIEAMREEDWSAVVPGVHGALLLAAASPEAKAEFHAFIAGLQTGEIDKGVRFLLKRAGIIGGK